MTGQRNPKYSDAPYELALIPVGPVASRDAWMPRYLQPPPPEVAADQDRYAVWLADNAIFPYL